MRIEDVVALPEIDVDVDIDVEVDPGADADVDVDIKISSTPISKWKRPIVSTRTI